MKQPAIYILANQSHTTLYIGVTSNLIKRIYQHRIHAVDGFSKRYILKKLLYFEIYEDMYTALSREKQLKKWRRNWKDELISKLNPEWKDLWYEYVTSPTNQKDSG